MCFAAVIVLKDKATTAASEESRRQKKKYVFLSLRLRLETVDLDSLLVHLELSGQELQDLSSLVTLELENVTKFFILIDMAVAAKILLQSLENLLEVIFTGDTLDSSNGLTAVTLLMSDMNVVGRRGFFVTSLGERIFTQLLVDL